MDIIRYLPRTFFLALLPLSLLVPAAAAAYPGTASGYPSSVSGYPGSGYSGSGSGYPGTPLVSSNPTTTVEVRAHAQERANFLRAVANDLQRIERRLMGPGRGLDLSQLSLGRRDRDHKWFSVVAPVLDEKKSPTNEKIEFYFNSFVQPGPNGAALRWDPKPFKANLEESQLKSRKTFSIS